MKYIVYRNIQIFVEYGFYYASTEPSVLHKHLYQVLHDIDKLVGNPPEKRVDIPNKIMQLIDWRNN